MCGGAILEIKRGLLGLEVPTPEDRVRKEEKIPEGWLNRIIRMLNGFGEQLEEIHKLEKVVLNAIVENPELKGGEKQSETREAIR